MAIRPAPYAQLSTEQKETLISFLKDVALNPPPAIEASLETLDKEVWSEVDCLRCANCCRTMTPHFTTSDIKRIATHFRITTAAVKQRWLEKDKNGAWINRQRPCPFLDTDTNKCRIYAIRPEDCAGFPHLTKKPLANYAHMHMQNLSFCPATAAFVQKLESHYPETSMEI